MGFLVKNLTSVSYINITVLCVLIIQLWFFKLIDVSEQPVKYFFFEFPFFMKLRKNAAILPFGGKYGT